MIERGKSDYMDTAGEFVLLTLGPVMFYVNTADGGAFGVSLVIFGHEFNYGGGRL